MARDPFLCDPNERTGRNGILSHVTAMQPEYLIDGYNLIHALGLVHKQAAPGELERSRHALAAMLEAHAAKGAFTVVFDAKRKPRRGAGAETIGAIQVRYAVGREADEMLEELIVQHPRPARLNVVSDDRRVQEAARRARAVPLGCQAFLDLLERPPAAAPAADAAEPGKETPLSGAERRRWLEEFGDVQIPDELREPFSQDE